jgi:glyoxylase-like metal-dependent hydrolase (beta-lactamase superfamily II)
MNCYVVSEGDEAVVIDPGEAAPELLAYIAPLKVTMIVNTHGHCDHCGGNAGVVAATGAPLAIHLADLPLLQSLEHQGRMFGVAFPPSPEPDVFLEAGQFVPVGETRFEVRHSPGHSPGHIVLVTPGTAFVGDVLFEGSIGRTDLPGGDFGQLIHSIKSQLLTLPDDTVVYSGHGPATTIGAERATNPFLV